MTDGDRTEIKRLHQTHPSHRWASSARVDLVAPGGYVLTFTHLTQPNAVVAFTVRDGGSTFQLCPAPV